MRAWSGKERRKAGNPLLPAMRACTEHNLSAPGKVLERKGAVTPALSPPNRRGGWFPALVLPAETV